MSRRAPLILVATAALSLLPATPPAVAAGTPLAGTVRIESPGHGGALLHVPERVRVDVDTIDVIPGDQTKHFYVYFSSSDCPESEENNGWCQGYEAIHWPFFKDWVGHPTPYIEENVF